MTCFKKVARCSICGSMRGENFFTALESENMSDSDIRHFEFHLIAKLQSNILTFM